MSSKIKVDNIADQGNNNLINKCGSTITLGASGDTIELASGASQTGFGRTGTVDWDTTKKTASFTAVSGEGYFVDTSSSAITVTLPASPSAGDIVAVADYAGTAATNVITIARNSSPFEGGTEDGGIATNRQTGTFIYVDGTQGWVAVNSNDASFILPTYVAATGGTVTTCGNFKIHTFTGPGTFCVSSVGNPVGSSTVSYMVIAGGGSGALGPGVNDRGGGGGAGGYREGKASSDCYTASPLNAPAGLPVSVQAYPITVGGGGAQKSSFGGGNSGSNSVFSTITSAGGGGGGRSNPATGGNTGGSGAGAGGGVTGGTSGAAGNTPPVSPPQGNPGGTGGGTTPNVGGGGGGGATSAGGNAGPGVGGDGGTGATTSINGSATGRAGGGAGCKNASATCGGAGGPAACQAATANTGGGGQGGHPCGGGNGSAGGSGIVIIRYKFQ